MTKARWLRVELFERDGMPGARAVHVVTKHTAEGVGVVDEAIVRKWARDNDVPIVDLRKPGLGPPLQPPNEHRTYIVRYHNGMHSEWLTYAQALTLSWRSTAPTRILRLDHVERVMP